MHTHDKIIFIHLVKRGFAVVEGSILDDDDITTGIRY